MDSSAGTSFPNELQLEVYLIQMVMIIGHLFRVPATAYPIAGIMFILWFFFSVWNKNFHLVTQKSLLFISSIII